jgi:hypothetical protein
MVSKFVCYDQLADQSMGLQMNSSLPSLPHPSSTISLSLIQQRKERLCLFASSPLFILLPLPQNLCDGGRDPGSPNKDVSTSHQSPAIGPRRSQENYSGRTVRPAPDRTRGGNTRQHPTLGTRGRNPYQATRVLLGKETTRAESVATTPAPPCHRTRRPLPRSVFVHPKKTP